MTDALDEAAVAWRMEVMRSQLTEGAAVPFLIARPDAPELSVQGHCLSCGDVLTEWNTDPDATYRSYRCRPCADAVARRLVPG